MVKGSLTHVRMSVTSVTFRVKWRDFRVVYHLVCRQKYFGIPEIQAYCFSQHNFWKQKIWIGLAHDRLTNTLQYTSFTTSGG